MNQRPQWDRIKDAFAFDGSWNDIYVLNTSGEDWKRFLRALSAWPHPHHYRVGEMELKPPAFFEEALRHRRSNSATLQVMAGDVDVRCHFFSDRQIEFDLDPRDVTSQSSLDAVCGFMEFLGRAVGREVRMTPENAPEVVLLAYDPVSDRWKVEPVVQ